MDPRRLGQPALPVVAKSWGVLVSGRSDDHGKRTADGAMRLGAQPVPREVLEALRERVQRRPRLRSARNAEREGLDHRVGQQLAAIR